jgi:glycosyltransferase involved in cell wall biosynthesis
MIIAAMPAHNEVETIAKGVLGAKKHVDKVVVVDDGSEDMTAEIADALGAMVVRHKANKGYGAAIRTCFETANQTLKKFNQKCFATTFFLPTVKNFTFLSTGSFVRKKV